jgi:hypothetical protein
MDEEYISSTDGKFEEGMLHLRRIIEMVPVFIDSIKEGTIEAQAALAITDYSERVRAMAEIARKRIPPLLDWMRQRFEPEARDYHRPVSEVLSMWRRTIEQNRTITESFVRQRLNYVQALMAAQDNARAGTETLRAPWARGLPPEISDQEVRVAMRRFVDVLDNMISYIDDHHAEASQIEAACSRWLEERK